VDGRDFLAWQRGYGRVDGATPSDGDATGDGDVDGNDLAVWQETYGEEQEVADLGLRIAELSAEAVIPAQCLPLAEAGAGIQDSRTLTPNLPSALSPSPAVSRPEKVSSDDPAFEDHYVDQVDRAFDQWTLPRRFSADFGDIATRRPTARPFELKTEFV
jgi:hypothetical protein